MDSVNKTLYIPLYGKALVSRKGILLRDAKAEDIWEKEGFPLKGKSKSKWLAYYMSMRATVFDRWVEEQQKQFPDAAVLHLGCGLDNRIGRVKRGTNMWYDVDFPEVIGQRQIYFSETENYKMLGADVRQDKWLEEVTADSAIVVMEGISMYLQPEELKKLLEALHRRFSTVTVLMDCYTTLAAKASKYKNPINDVGVTKVYGLDDPRVLECTGFRYVKEMDMTPENMISQLSRMEQGVFRKLYAGKMARKLYQMYEFAGGEVHR